MATIPIAMVAAGAVRLTGNTDAQGNITSITYANDTDSPAALALTRLSDSTVVASRTIRRAQAQVTVPSGVPIKQGTDGLVTVGPFTLAIWWPA